MRGPVDPDHLPEGALVDCWRVVRPLGGGAYGSVYLVEKDGELYALKLARFLGNSGDARHTDERAQREVRCLLGLEHPHIAQVRNHGRWPHSKTGFFYLVMDYVEGCTLAEWVERTRATPHEVVGLFEKVLSAVAYVHAQGMLHRDLKPNNILVEASTGRPVVVDFGAAFYPAPAEPRLTDTRLPPGTPHYTSPEARHFEAHHRHDRRAFYEYKVSDELYALGVSLYDLLTDPQPHSRPRSWLQYQTGEPRACDVNVRVPLMLSDYTSRLVAPGPALRPESAELARRNLAELLLIDAPAWRQRPLHAPVPPPAEEQEAEPLPSTVLSPRTLAEPQQPPPGELDTPLPPEDPSPSQETPQAPAPTSLKQEPLGSAAAPVVLTPAPPAPPRPRRVGRAAVGALVLGLLVAAAALSVRPGAPEESAPVLLSGEPAAPLPTLPEASAPTAAPAPGEAPPPQPPVAPPVSTPEKGTPVNIRPPAQPATASVCAQKQPPPRGTPSWLKWCKCTAMVGSLVATQAGCPGAQLRQSLTEQCRPESVQAMEALGIDLSYDNDIFVELDMKQPSNGKNACGRDASGKIPIACIAEGPLTSKVTGGRRNGKLVRGTLLSGYAWLHSVDTSNGMDALYRWTEATLPDGSKYPVCIEGVGQGRECPNGAARECAAAPAEAVKSFRPIKLDR